ncbi:hypothetical protein [Nonomuraea dietziae]|uniref:hypothetical protein n=1 Tax=Nonomuraea dietziae TaxID=65515 RepID=UPI0031D9F691
MLGREFHRHVLASVAPSPRPRSQAPPQCRGGPARRVARAAGCSPSPTIVVRETLYDSLDQALETARYGTRPAVHD